MKYFLRSVFMFSTVLLVVGCGSTAVSENPTQIPDKQVNQILAAKVPFATAKKETPVLNTNDWDSVFGGASGKELKYDRYGEIDEVVFVAPAGTMFNLKRQIRKRTKQGDETLYYKVTTPIYKGSQALWVDGRFLAVSDIKPSVDMRTETAVKTLVNLRKQENQPYTWRGSSAKGIPELMLYYPPSEPLTARMENDWILKGFNSMGLLFRASNGATPLDVVQLTRFGSAVFKNLSDITGDDETPVLDKKAKAMLELLKPLDIIQFGDRVMIVLDRQQVMEAKYMSKFAGKVFISNLADTVYGLLEKGEFVEDPLQELIDSRKKKFFVRRYAVPAVEASGAGVQDEKNGEGKLSNADKTLVVPNSNLVVSPPAAELKQEGMAADATSK